MSAILAEVTAGYDARAREAAAPLALNPPVRRRPKPSKTYTGAALERRQAWGHFWGGRIAAASQAYKVEAAQRLNTIGGPSA